MDIDARIKRRQHQAEGPHLVDDYEAISPVAHVDEPSNRGPVLERLLDHFEPVFDGTLPPNAYLHGPMGAGKSAIVTALFEHLDRLSTEARSVIHTSTRAATPTTPAFVYVDLRTTTSEFAFYHDILDALVDEQVPDHGVSTESLTARLHEFLGETRSGVIVATDHVSDPSGVETDALIDRFAGLPSNVSWIAIGRAAPDSIALSEYTATSISVDPYRTEILVDVLMERASAGLGQQSLDHEQARQIADWAEGNAHDALAVLFVATDLANRDGREQLSTQDVAGAIEEMPSTSVSLGRVLALPANKQLVLRELVDLDPADRATVSATTDAISSSPAVDLSAGTVKRFLYETAELGIVERVESPDWDGTGRPPSRVELRFPPTAFRRLYDLRNRPNERR